MSPRTQIIVLAISLTAPNVTPRPLAAQTPAFATGEHQVVVNGVRLWYRVAGTSAPPVLFLHGGPGYNSYSFAQLEGPLLEKNLRMIYLDQRGSGRSSLVAEDAKITFAKHVDDIESLRLYFRLERISLLGHYWGAAPAAGCSPRRPGATRRRATLRAWRPSAACRTRAPLP